MATFEGQLSLDSEAYATASFGTLSKFNSTNESPFLNLAYYSPSNYDTHPRLTDSEDHIRDINDFIEIVTVNYFRRVVFQCLCDFLIVWLSIARLAKLKSPRLLNYYQFFFSNVSSTFQFLRYSGPRRLRPSRRVLVDNDEYQVTHVGRGAFATVSRVLHKPSGEMRAMKRIVFDKSGLAESLAQAEVDSLKAVMGSPWFPTLLNHFVDEAEYIITMVRSLKLLSLLLFIVSTHPIIPAIFPSGRHGGLNKTQGLSWP